MTEIGEIGGYAIAFGGFLLAGVVFYFGRKDHKEAMAELESRAARRKDEEDKRHKEAIARPGPAE